MLNLGYVRAVDSRMVPTHVAGASNRTIQDRFSSRRGDSVLPYFIYCLVFASIFPWNYRDRYRQQARENRDLFTNNFARHVSLNHHVQRRDNTNK